MGVLFNPSLIASECEHAHRQSQQVEGARSERAAKFLSWRAIHPWNARIIKKRGTLRDHPFKLKYHVLIMQTSKEYVSCDVCRIFGLALNLSSLPVA